MLSNVGDIPVSGLGTIPHANKHNFLKGFRKIIHIITRTNNMQPNYNTHPPMYFNNGIVSHDSWRRFCGTDVKQNPGSSLNVYLSPSQDKENVFKLARKSGK